MAVTKRKGLLPPSRQIKGKPVPGGKSQYGAGSADPARHFALGSPTTVGRNRGIKGGGTADVMGRTPAQQKRGKTGGLITGEAKAKIKGFFS